MRSCGVRGRSRWRWTFSDFLRKANGGGAGFSLNCEDGGSVRVRVVAASPLAATLRSRVFVVYMSEVWLAAVRLGGARLQRGNTPCFPSVVL